MLNSLMVLLSKNRKTLLWILSLLIIYFLAFHNLTRFPAPWFDEGSHLHVPKTLVNYGVYADISSEGFRYYGPTIGVGPTVMLPIAAIFKLFGIGLLQARLIMTLYMIAAIYAFYLVSKKLTNHYIALVACILLISSRVIFFLELGRQLLGEVPGLFFLLLGFLLWFDKWENASWKRLTLVGMLFGLAMITKYQYLLFLMPMFGLSWFLNLVYYKTSSHKHFIIPAFTASLLFAVWQGITIRYLGPATMLENLAFLRNSAQSAAFTIDLSRIAGTLADLKSRAVYLAALFPSLLYSFLISIPRNRESQKWSTLFITVAVNFVWYVIASIGWIRYAFLGLTFSSLFVARFFNDVTDGFKLELGWKNLSEVWQSLQVRKTALQIVLIVWLAVIIFFPISKTISEIASPEPDYAQEMSSYLNQNVASSSLIETWETEMGFLTDHNYHYPPNALLAVAVDQAYYGGKPVQDQYDFVLTEQPEYLLIGEFSKLTKLYPLQELKDHYLLVVTFGPYDLYRRVGS
jgi:hypothetical protein